MPKTAWDEFRYPTDGPYPIGHVRVAGVRLPVRVAILKGGVVLPIPWPPETEQRFRRWFTAFAKTKGWPTNPDHDRHSEVDWRVAWWAGARQIVEEITKTTSGPVPTERLDTFKRTENRQLVIARR